MDQRSPSEGHGKRRRRRLSQPKRQFLQKCLGDDFGSDPETLGEPSSDEDEDEVLAKRMRFLLSKDSDAEDDSQEDDDAGPSLNAIYSFDAAEMARLCMRNVVNYIFIDDDEEDGCTDGIEEVFSFDLEKVAEALRRGADQDELSQIIEEAMIQDLPQRIAESEVIEVHETSSTVTPCTGDLSALMTPPRRIEDLMTPPEGTVSPHFGRGAVSSTILAERLQNIQGEGCAGCASRRRRSSIAQHPQLLEAVSTAQSRHRRSLAKVLEAELREASRRSLAASLSVSPEEGLPRPSAAQVRRSVAGVQRRRRSSLIRAAEVLEAAGVGVGQDAQREVDRHLDVVQRAVEMAARRHRQSILVAVAQIPVTVDEEEPEPMPEAEPKSGATSPRPSFFQAWVNDIVAVGYEAFKGCLYRK